MKNKSTAEFAITLSNALAASAKIDKELANFALDENNPGKAQEAALSSQIKRELAAFIMQALE